MKEAHPFKNYRSKGKEDKLMLNHDEKEGGVPPEVGTAGFLVI